MSRPAWSCSQEALRLEGETCAAVSRDQNDISSDVCSSLSNRLYLIHLIGAQTKVWKWHVCGLAGSSVLDLEFLQQSDFRQSESSWAGAEIKRGARHDIFSWAEQSWNSANQHSVLPSPLQTPGHVTVACKLLSANHQLTQREACNSARRKWTLVTFINVF